MALVAIVTDLHFGARNDDDLIIKNHLKFLNELFTTMQQRGITYLLNLGDTWDKRKVHNIRTYNIFRKEFFQKIQEQKITSYHLIGNHDIYYKNTNLVNSVMEFDDGQYINVINGFEDIVIDNTTFGMMSWINNDTLEHAIEFATKTSNASIVCGHFETIGFEMLKGVKCEHGLDSGLFKRFNRVWSGHFHIPSQQGNFEYIGNACELTWSDYNTRKGFLIYDTETDEIEYVVNKNTLFEIIRYNDGDVIDVEQYKDKIVRVYVAGQSITLNDFIVELQKQAYKVDVIDESVIDVNDELVLDNPEEGRDTLATIRQVLDNIELVSVDKSKLTQMVENLYNEALQGDNL